MAVNTHQLSSLPVELLYCIFRQLDPVALIAASQTSSHFRSIIQPAKKHFAERLLALEIEPEHGGPGFTYFARQNRLDPDWSDHVWNEMRWACTNCLQLLPHAAFDNHSLLRLRNRKPAPGSPAAKRYSGITGWEPVESKALNAKAMRRKRALITKEKGEEKLIRRQYHIATTKTLNNAPSRYTIHTRTQFLKVAELPEALECSDMQLDSLTEDQEHALLDQAAQRIEGLRAGSHRHLRKCNECRFQLGQFKQGPFIPHGQQMAQDGKFIWTFNNNKGTTRVPIVRSRRLKFATPFDRYFPGIGPYMSAQRPQFILPVFRIYRDETSYLPITLYMVRCPLCATWQELRAFRWAPRGWGYGEFIGVGSWMSEAEVGAYMEDVDNLRCNRCVHNSRGPSALAEQLSTFMIARLRTERRAVLDMLSGGWRPLEYNRFGLRPPKNQSVIKQLLKSLEAAERKFAKVKDEQGWVEVIDIEADDIEDNLAVMNWRRLEWLQISKEEAGLASDCAARWESFGVWQDQWDQAVEYWRWAKAWSEEIEQEPGKVVRWALERHAMQLN